MSNIPSLINQLNAQGFPVSIRQPPDLSHFEIVIPTTSLGNFYIICDKDLEKGLERMVEGAKGAEPVPVPKKSVFRQLSDELDVTRNDENC